MKALSTAKRIFTLALAAVLLCTAAGLFFGGKAMAESLEAPSALRDKYEVTVTVSSQRLSVGVKGMLRLTYTNTSADELFELVLNVYANVLCEDGVKLSSVGVNGMAADYSLNKSILTVKLPAPLKPNKTAELFMRFSFTLPEEGGRFGANAIGRATFVQMLGNALPIAAMYENGAWRTDAYNDEGDPFYSRISDYTVVVTAPEYYEIAHTGTELGRKVEDGKKSVYIWAPAVREFAFALINDCARADILCDNGRVAVHAFAKTDEQAGFAADCAANAIEYFTKKIGSYPYEELFVVPFEIAGGMEYPGLIMIDKQATLYENRGEGALMIGHEVAHQWFYAVVGNDQINAPWLDEALTEYLGCEFLEEYSGSYAAEVIAKRYEGFDGLKRIHRIDAPMNEMSVFYAYTVYGCGCSLYARLVEEIGEEAFFEGLKNYYNANYMGIGTKESLVAAFSLSVGKDMTDWFEHNLGLNGGDR